MNHSTSAAGWQKVGRFAPLLGIGADLAANTDLIRRVRKAQDPRQRFWGQLHEWKTLGWVHREHAGQGGGRGVWFQRIVDTADRACRGP
jgi:hypothetical protein